MRLRKYLNVKTKFCAVKFESSAFCSRALFSFVSRYYKNTVRLLLTNDFVVRTSENPIFQKNRTLLSFWAFFNQEIQSNYFSEHIPQTASELAS